MQGPLPVAVREWRRQRPLALALVALAVCAARVVLLAGLAFTQPSTGPRLSGRAFEPARAPHSGDGGDEEIPQRSSAAEPRPTSRHRLFGVGLLSSAVAAAAVALGGFASKASADEEQAAASVVLVDESGLLAPSTRTTLTSLLQRVERDTGLKLRVLCPKQGIQMRREEWKEYLRPISKSMGVDPNSLVIVAEQRAQLKTGRMLGLFSLNPGIKLQERYQYRLTNDLLLRESNTYGDPRYVDANGTDQAIQEVTRNLAAVLYGLQDDPIRRFAGPLSAEEVRAILEKHGA